MANSAFAGKRIRWGRRTAELQSGKSATCGIANYGMKMRKKIRVDQWKGEEWGRARAGKLSFCQLRREEDNTVEKST